MNTKSENPVRKNRNPIVRIWRFYYEGFRHMTIGKTLWAIILLKLFIFFAVLKFFFFPDILKRDFDTDEERAGHVRAELTDEKRVSGGSEEKSVGMVSEVTTESGKEK